MNKKKITLLCALTYALISLPNLALAQNPQPAAGAAPAIEDGSFRERLIDFNVLGAADATDFLGLDNWDVKLNPSSDFTYDKRFTYSKKVNSESGKFFLGIRSHFPKIQANSFAIAEPRYSLSFYNPETGLPQNDIGKGVVANVGSVKQAFVRVAGRNYPHALILNMVRNSGEGLAVNFGNLLFAGWNTLEWTNPQYLSDYRDRQSFITPLYPRLIPSIRFDNLIVFRSKQDSPGNFIGYVDWIDLRFDRYYAQEELDVISGEEDFINDEDVWQIIRRESGGAEARLLKKKIEDYQRLERLEKLKMNLPTEGPLPNGAENITPN